MIAGVVVGAAFLYAMIGGLVFGLCYRLSEEFRKDWDNGDGDWYPLWVGVAWPAVLFFFAAYLPYRAVREPRKNRALVRAEKLAALEKELMG